VSDYSIQITIITCILEPIDEALFMQLYYHR